MSEKLFVSTAQKAISNSAAETSLIGSGSGNLTLPKHFWTVGRSVKIKFSGTIATTATPTARAKLKIGATTLLDTTALTLPAISGTCDIFGEATITCRSASDTLAGTNGSLMADMDISFSVASTGGAINNLVCVPALTSSFDTKVAAAIDMTWTFGTASASNAIAIDMFSVEYN